MPELPEVETIVRGLRPRIVGRVVEEVEVVHDDVLASPAADFRACLGGRTVQDVGRRGKNVVARLSGDTVLRVNLGMTGRLLPVEEHAELSEEATHPAVRLLFRNGGALVYDDTRRFGLLECLSSEAWERKAAELGPEPLSPTFTARRLHEGLARSRSPARSWLLDQRRVAGVGNIYANEALHGARVHPRRPAESLSRDDAARLHRALRSVLRRAIEARGTTLHDYRDSEGDRGAFARSLEVYGREGEPCLRCETPVERLVFGSRSAFLCPACQPEAP